MLRHIQNSQELILYSSLSCAAGFLARLVPAFYIPIMLLRIGIFAYCAIALYRGEGQKEVALLIGAALSIGFVGSQLDLIELLIRYDLPNLMMQITTLLVFVALAVTLFYQFKK